MLRPHKRQRQRGDTHLAQSRYSPPRTQLTLGCPEWSHSQEIIFIKCSATDHDWTGPVEAAKVPGLAFSWNLLLHACCLLYLLSEVHGGPKQVDMAILSLILGLCPFLCLPQLLPVLAFLWGFTSLLFSLGFSRWGGGGGTL